MKSTVGTAFAVMALVALGACARPGTSNYSAKANVPRPPQLALLDHLLGDWETTGEVRMIVLDEPVQTSGRNHAKWAMNDRFLVEQAELDMGPMGEITGTSIWTWDRSARQYRMWWFDSLGEYSEAIVRYDEAKRTFRMKAKGSKYGYRTSGRGTLKLVDDDTVEWTWNEYDALGLIRFATMKGTSRRPSR